MAGEIQWMAVQDMKTGKVEVVNWLRDGKDIKENQIVIGWPVFKHESDALSWAREMYARETKTV